MVASEPPHDPAEMIFRIGDLEIRMAGVRADVHQLDEKDTVLVELFHPLLTGLPPDLAEEAINGLLTAVLGGRVPRKSLVAIRTEQEPRAGRKPAELRALLATLDQ